MNFSLVCSSLSLLMLVTHPFIGLLIFGVNLANKTNGDKEIHKTITVAYRGSFAGFGWVEILVGITDLPLLHLEKLKSLSECDRGNYLVIDKDRTSVPMHAKHS